VKLSKIGTFTEQDQINQRCKSGNFRVEQFPFLEIYRKITSCLNENFS